MEQQPHQPNGGDHDRGVNSYGTDDPETQAHIENARIDAAEERKRDRAKFERLIELGMNAEDAQSFIEFEDYIASTTDQSPAREEAPPWPTHDTDESAERVKQCEPRIYVADMTSAQRGISHGLWVDADQDPDELDSDIAAMLEASPTPGATEWAIRATEDFAGIVLNDCTDVMHVSILGKGVADHGPAFSSWVAINGTDDLELLDHFTDYYVGSYESAEAWMREVADDLGWQKQRERIADPLLQPYVTLDYAAMAKDAARSWDAVTGIDGRFYVFLR